MWDFLCFPIFIKKDYSVNRVKQSKGNTGPFQTKMKIYLILCVTQGHIQKYLGGGQICAKYFLPPPLLDPRGGGGGQNLNCNIKTFGFLDIRHKLSSEFQGGGGGATLPSSYRSMGRHCPPCIRPKIIIKLNI